MSQLLGSGSPPNFVTKPSVKQVEDKIILECQLTADPEPSISWLLNNKPIKSGGRILTKTTREGNVYLLVLQLSQLCLDDGGNYQCIAKNERGEATATVMLSLEGKQT